MPTKYVRFPIEVPPSPAEWHLKGTVEVDNTHYYEVNATSYWVIEKTCWAYVSFVGGDSSHWAEAQPNLSASAVRLLQAGDCYGEVMEAGKYERQGTCDFSYLRHTRVSVASCYSRHGIVGVQHGDVPISSPIVSILPVNASLLLGRISTGLHPHKLP